MIVGMCIIVNTYYTRACNIETERRNRRRKGIEESKGKKERERRRSMATFSSYAAQLHDIIQYRNEVMNFRAHSRVLVKIFGASVGLCRSFVS